MTKKKSLVALISVATVMGVTGCAGLFGPSLAPGETVIADLKIGDCITLEDPNLTEATTVMKIDCSEPHEDEVFHIFNASFDVRPSDDDLFDHADEVCDPIFERYVGSNLMDSELFTWSFIPLQDGWDAGDRQIVCMVSPMNGAVDFSVKDSNI